MVPVDNSPDGLTEVAQQVPASGHLNCVRRTLPDAVGIGTRPVPRDDLDPGVLAKPRCEGFGLAIRQQVHDLVALEIDESGVIAVPFL